MNSFHSNPIEKARMWEWWMSQTLTWEEFKLWLDGSFTLHHLMLQDGMELLEFTQGDDMGLLTTYV
jgi:hypothetical protein